MSEFLHTYFNDIFIKVDVISERKESEGKAPCVVSEYITCMKESSRPILVVIAMLFPVSSSIAEEMKLAYEPITRNKVLEIIANTSEGEVPDLSNKDFRGPGYVRY